MLKDADRLLARHSWKTGKEIVEAGAIPQILKQCPQRHASATEDPRPAHQTRAACRNGPKQTLLPIARPDTL